MRFWSILVVLLLLVLTGCLDAEFKPKPSMNPTLSQLPPTVNVEVPPAQTVDTEGLQKALTAEILTSSNATQNQLSGLVNASVSKIGEKVTGVELQLSELVKLTANVNTEVKTDVKAKLDAALNLVATLKTEISVLNTFNNKMEAKFEASVRDLQASIENKLDVSAQAIAGVGVKVDTVKNDIGAGRDVNYLPKEVVTIMDNNNKTWLGIITGFFSIIGTVCGMAYRNARAREMHTNQLLMAVLAKADPKAIEGIDLK